MSPITLFMGDITDLYNYYGKFNTGYPNYNLTPVITNSPNGLYNSGYEKRLSQFRGFRVSDTNSIVQVPKLYKVLEALYITETIYTTSLIYPNDGRISTRELGIGAVYINSFNLVRSNLELSFDSLLPPTLKPLNQTPMSGYRDFSNQLPTGWDFDGEPLGYHPVIQDKVRCYIATANEVICQIDCKRWQKVPVQVPGEIPAGTVYNLYQIPTIIEEVTKPIYIDLLSGYAEDSRTIADKPIIDIDEPKTIKISYYRENKTEPIPQLRSIDWMTYFIDLVVGLNTLPIFDCVLGTLIVSDSVIKSKISQLTTINQKYPHKYYFSEHLPELFNQWYQIAGMTLPIAQGNLRIIGANNNHWNNRAIPTPDLNYNAAHQLFAINNQRAYDWHIKPQSDGSFGDLVMNSPKLEEIHRALNAGQYLLETPAIVGTGTIDNPQTPATHKLDWYIKNSAGEKVTAIWKALGGNKYGTNQLDNTKDRVTNLGFLVERIAKVLGIRFDDNGKIDVDKEKSIVRKVIDGTKNVDPEKVGVNSFGDGGLVVKRINNRFKQKGEIVSDQCVVVQDMPDLIQEYFHQANLALGIQESSAIEIKQDGTAARFNSQLEVLIELVNLMSSGNEMTRAALVSSLVTQSQTNELIAGLGLPSVTKTIPIKIGKKVSQVPFKGIAAHRSIAQEVATCTYNVGIVLGQVL
jgi:hypothetical protein